MVWYWYGVVFFSSKNCRPMTNNTKRIERWRRTCVGANYAFAVLHSAGRTKILRWQNNNRRTRTDGIFDSRLRHDVVYPRTVLRSSRTNHTAHAPPPGRRRTCLCAEQLFDTTTTKTRAASDDVVRRIWCGRSVSFRTIFTHILIAARCVRIANCVSPLVPPSDRLLFCRCAPSTFEPSKY